MAATEATAAVAPAARSDWSALFALRSTVWPTVWPRALLAVAYGVGVQSRLAPELDLGSLRTGVLACALCLLLAFRLSVAYRRHRAARDAVAAIYRELGSVTGAAILSMAGGERNRSWRWRRHIRASDGQLEGKLTTRELPAPDAAGDRAASEDRTQLVRWALVVGISVRMAARLLDVPPGGSMSRLTKWLLDWDRYRMRHLVGTEEFGDLDRYVRLLTLMDEDWDDAPVDDLGGNDARLYIEHGPLHLQGCSGWFRGLCGGFSGGPGPTLSAEPNLQVHGAALYRFAEALTLAADDARSSRPHGFPERLLPALLRRVRELRGHVSLALDDRGYALPFVFLNFSTVLLAGYFALYPFYMERELGLYVNAIELAIVALAMLGTDALASALDAPGTSSLVLDGSLAGLERELLSSVELAGDETCRRKFLWVDVPAAVVRAGGAASGRAPTFLALRAQHGGRDDVVTKGSRASRAAAPAARRSSAGGVTPGLVDDSASDG
eukprot:TRINITY_DN8229_c0_g3_i1.p1 TRINITY_DN8229_c0_g3~~TRINITY_DN8229_c0_g3_i1.p1  ORF type:complete len:497 (+),score=118.21 TRINITY_DN8229_c0_g3_i1:81-1571(+)